jgi:hypothetical protein
MTPAEERAQRESLPVVRIIPFEALRIAEGNPMICETVSGDQVLVRLYTTDEFYDMHVEAVEQHGGKRATREEIDDRTRPLRLGGLSW